MTMVATLSRAVHAVAAALPAAEIPHDARLPQLATVLDAAAMRDVLAAVTGWSLAGCRIESVRYRPGERCLVAYRLLRLGADGASTEEAIVARVYPIGASARPHAKAAATTPDLLHVAPLGMIAWRWPSDRKLAHLTAFTDPDVLRDGLLPRLVAARWRGVARIVDAAFAIVRYVPEQGCTLRATLTIDLGIGVRTRVVWYGKTLAAGRAEKTWATLQAVAAAGVGVSAPVALDVATGSVWVAEVGGRTLADRLACEAMPDAEWARLGRAVARLHAVPVEPRAGEPDEDANPLERAGAILGTTLPHLAPRLAQLLPRIEAGIAADASRVMLHGDLHPGNVLLDGRRATLIDFDASTVGRRTADLGSFIAAVRVHALHPGIGGAATGPTVTRAAIARFVAAYERTARVRLDRRLLAAATAYALVTERACRAVTRMKPGRRATVDTLVALAEALVAGTAHV